MLRFRRPAARLACASFAAAALPAFAQAPAPALPIVPQQVTCRGEEPFWRLDANRQNALLTRPLGKGPKELVFRGELATISFLTPKAIVWRGQSTHLPSETLVATLREESCRSTMADTPPEAWRAILTTRPGEAVTGCCTVKSGYDALHAPLAAFEKKSAEDWSRRYPELSAAIRRCVSDAGVVVREVAQAAFAGGGTARVRVVAADGKSLDCTTDLAGKSKPRVAMAASAPPAGQPVFYPVRADPPIVSCGKLERIPAGTSKTRSDGWLHYERC